jgi:hypothetical protein
VGVSPASVGRTDRGVLQTIDVWQSTKPINNLRVVIWSGHIGSYKDQAPLLGKYLRKDLVNRGTLG